MNDTGGRRCGAILHGPCQGSKYFSKTSRPPVLELIFLLLPCHFSGRWLNPPHKPELLRIKIVEPAFARWLIKSFVKSFIEAIGFQFAFKFSPTKIKNKIGAIYRGCHAIILLDPKYIFLGPEDPYGRIRLKNILQFRGGL